MTVSNIGQTNDFLSATVIVKQLYLRVEVMKHTFPLSLGFVVSMMNKSLSDLWKTYPLSSTRVPKIKILNNMSPTKRST